MELGTNARFALGLVALAAVGGSLAVLKTRGDAQQAPVVAAEAATLPAFSTPDLLPAITEQETKAASGDAEQKALLAGLYVRQAKVTGDVTWYDKAEATAKESLAAKPDGNTHAKLALSETLEKRHLFAESMRIAKEVVTAEPRNPEALAVYSTVCLAIGEIDEAIRTADLAAMLTPSAVNLTVRALALNARGRDQEADAMFRAALAKDDLADAPGSANTRTVYARFLITKGRYGEARRFVDEALKIVPGQHLALSISGDLNLKTKEPAKAAKDFEDAFAASPQVSYLRKFSRAKSLLKDERGAEDAMREALALAHKEIDSGVHAHPLELAYVHIASDDSTRWQEAARLANGELNTRHSVLPYSAMAQAYEKLGDWTAGTEAVDAILRTGVRNPEYYLLAARIAKGAGDLERARFYFSAAAAEDPNLSEPKDALKVASK